jgi:hypothetical protein
LNPRPENKTQRAYMLSQCFESRTREHPLTGFLSSQPIRFRSPGIGVPGSYPAEMAPSLDLKRAESPVDVAVKRPVLDLFLRLCLFST